MGQPGAQMDPLRARKSQHGTQINKLLLKLVKCGPNEVDLELNRVNRLKWVNLWPIWVHSGPESISLGLEWINLWPNGSTQA